MHQNKNINNDKIVAQRVNDSQKFSYARNVVSQNMIHPPNEHDSLNVPENLCVAWCVYMYKYKSIYANVRVIFSAIYINSEKNGRKNNYEIEHIVILMYEI